MAQATNSQLGEIQLAGDLAGNGGAQVGTNPQLKTMPGLSPGQYIVPRITVDSKGRVTAIENGVADIADLLPSATADSAGVISIGDNLYVSGEGEPGFWTASFNGTLTTSTLTGLANQACATFGFDVAVDYGPTQQIRVTGDDAQNVGNLINEINTKLSGAVAGLVNGNFVITSLSEGNNSRIQVSNVSLFACMNGFVSITGETAGLGSCEVYVKRGSIDDYGVVKIGNGIIVEDGVISVDTNNIPIATTTTQGGVIVPVSGRLVVDSNGNLSVPTATDTIPGVVKVGTGLTVTAGSLGVSLPNATASTKGVVKVGTNIAVTAGTISVPNADASNIGVAQIGAGLTSTAGVVSLNIASASTLGAVKGGGTGVSIAGDGTISTAPVSVPDATASTKGVVQIGSGISVSAGLISVADATTSSKGVVQVGAGLTATAGVLTPVLANGTTKGIVASANTAAISIINGVIDIVGGTFLSTSVANTYTKAQVSAAYDLGVNSTITPSLDASNTFTWTPSGVTAGTINAPTNAVAGGIYTFIITTPVGFTNLTVPATFKFPGGARPVPSNNGKDILSAVYDGTNYLCTYVRGIA